MYQTTASFSASGVCSSFAVSAGVDAVPVVPAFAMPQSAKRPAQSSAQDFLMVRPPLRNLRIQPSGHSDRIALLSFSRSSSGNDNRAIRSECPVNSKYGRAVGLDLGHSGSPFRLGKLGSPV